MGIAGVIEPTHLADWSFESFPLGCLSCAPDAEVAADAPHLLSLLPCATCSARHEYAPAIFSLEFMLPLYRKCPPRYSKFTGTLSTLPPWSVLRHTTCRRLLLRRLYRRSVFVAMMMSVRLGKIDIRVRVRIWGVASCMCLSFFNVVS